MLTELVELPGGSFRMGSTSFYPEEAPIHAVAVAAFAIERHPVTNAQFAEFVDESGYVTVAERDLDPALYPGANPADLVPGALVFRPTSGPVDLGDWRQWWDWEPGACWRHPFGPESGVDDRLDHPVVQVAYPDAAAYARWAGRRLPSEAEWEYAARGGSTAIYGWGDDPAPDGRLMANTWQGEFPWENLASDGYERTSPVGAFPPNGYGLHDMIGNVWEWTTDWYVPKHPADVMKACCVPRNPRGPKADESYDPCQPDIKIPRKVIKGGSHLCAPNYCRRYRPAARFPEPVDTSTCHVGFRCIVRPPSVREP